MRRKQKTDQEYAQQFGGFVPGHIVKGKGKGMGSGGERPALPQPVPEPTPAPAPEPTKEGKK